MANNERRICVFGTKFAANLDVASTQLDQFIRVLVWKTGPMVSLCALGAIVLRQLLRRFARRVTRFIRARWTDRTEVKTPPCPSCERPMVKRRVRRGFRAGSEFWGCSNYPVCTDTRGL